MSNGANCVNLTVRLSARSGVVSTGRIVVKFKPGILSENLPRKSKFGYHRKIEDLVSFFYRRHVFAIIAFMCNTQYLYITHSYAYRGNTYKTHH
jgi:hypothetical protein